MDAIKALGQHTSHTLNAYGRTEAPTKDDIRPVHANGAVYDWSDDELRIAAIDDPHLLVVTFSPDDFTFCLGAVHDITKGTCTFIEKQDRVNALCRYVLGFLDI